MHGSVEENTDGGTLFDLVRRGRYRQARLLLEAGTDPNQRTSNQESPLMLAVVYIPSSDNRRRMMKLLLEFGADTNVQDDRGQTTLMHACILNQLDSTSLLLEQKGILPNLKDIEGNTALMYASAFGFFDIVKTFLDFCHQHRIFVHLNAENDCGKTAFSLAVENAHHDTARCVWNEIQRYQVLIERLSWQEKYDMGLILDNDDPSSKEKVEITTVKSRPKSRRHSRRSRTTSANENNSDQPNNQHQSIISVSVKNIASLQTTNSEGELLSSTDKVISEESGRKTYVKDEPDVLCKSCSGYSCSPPVPCPSRQFLTSPTDDEIHKEIDQLKLSTRLITFAGNLKNRPLPKIGHTTDERVVVKLPPIRDAVLCKSNSRPLKLRSLDSDLLNSSLDLSMIQKKSTYSKVSPLVHDTTLTEEQDANTNSEKED